MTEQQIDALYELALAGDTNAADQLISLLTSDNRDLADAETRDFAAWALIELIDGNALDAEQVKSVRAADWSALDAEHERRILDDAVMRFEKRQPQPCRECGRDDCRCRQIDADRWIVGKPERDYETD